jgi:hypothetical protein
MQGFVLEGQESTRLGELGGLEIYYFPEGSNPVSNPNDKRAANARRRQDRLMRSNYAKFSPVPKTETNELDKRNGIITVTILDGVSLANNGPFDSLYVIIRDNCDKRYRTRPIASTSTPNWEQTFKFNVSSSFIGFIIKLWATSPSKTTADTLLGQCLLNLEEFSDGEKREEAIKLKKEPKRYKSGKKHGHLRIVWQYNDKKLKIEKKSEPAVPGDQSSEITVTEKKNLEDIYEVGEKLGEGAFSVVKIGTQKVIGTKVAIKILDNYSNIENGKTSNSQPINP